jgi:hypothetical protein
MTDVVLCPATSTPVRRCTCPDHLGGRANIDGVTVVSGECGSRNGYLRHWRHKESACEPCTKANAAYRKAHFGGTRERNRIYQKAWRKASIRLQRMYPRLWRALLLEEQQKAGAEAAELPPHRPVEGAA